MSRRYPLEPLAEAMCLSMNQACLKLGVSGTTQKEYRARGVTELVADRLAVRAGYHPAEIWFDFGMELCPDCGSGFAPSRRTQKFCSHACADRYGKRRRYHEDPDHRRQKREQNHRWNTIYTEYKNAQERRRYWADPERERARKRRERQTNRGTTGPMENAQ